MKGRKQPSSNRSPKRKLEIIRGMIRQILVGLKACHNTGAPTGIVPRLLSCTCDPMLQSAA